MLAPRSRVLALALLVCACRTGAPAPTNFTAPTQAASRQPLAADGKLTPPALKLPGDVRPTSGELDLSIDPAAPTFHGVARYQLQVREPTRVVWINATDLTFSKVTLTQAGSQRVAQVGTGDKEFVPLIFPEPLATGAATLELQYQGLVDHTRSQGIYAAEENGSTYAYTFFEPVDARRAFPSFDQPDAKIPWTLTLRVPLEDLAAANTAPVSETKTAGDKPERVVHFAQSRPLPSYLVAFMIGPFDVVDGGTAGEHGTPLRFLVPKGRGAETAYAREVTPRIVTLLERYFGMPYPYGKLDVAVVPRYWGTMEHPGLVALGQPLTLIKPEEDSEQRRHSYARVAIHELAHYWFGDLVTCAFWDDTWLNESLGTWLEMKLVRQFEPRWRDELARPLGAARAGNADELRTAKPLGAPIRTREDIESSFDGELTYLKGAAVLDMLEYAAGEAAFQRFIRKYIARHLDGVATGLDFEHELAAELGPQLAAALRGFRDQPGLPRLTAKVDCSGNTPSLVVSQSRSSAAKSTPLPPEQWTVPVCFRAFAAPKPEGKVDARCVTLNGASAHFALELPTCPAALTLKPAGIGYYRVDYELGEYAASRLGNASPLSAAEKLALMKDLRNRVDRGDLALSRELSTVPALSADSLPELNEEGLSVLHHLPYEAVLAEDRTRFAQFVRKQAEPVLRRWGMRTKPNERSAVEWARAEALWLMVARVGDAAVSKDVRAAAEGLIAGRTHAPAEEAEELLSLAALRADRALQDELIQGMRASHETQVRARYLIALGQVPEPLLPASFALTLDPSVDLRESADLLRSALNTERGREPTEAFVLEHFDSLAARMRPDEVGLLVSFFSSLCDDAHADALQTKLAQKLAKVDGGPHALTKAVEVIHACAARARLEQPQLHDFLK